MPQSKIRINTVIGSNDDLPINVVVNLDNANTGGEVSYLWEIVSQPEGPADALSSSSLSAVTFTPTKEGSYLIRLTVNGSLIDTVIAAVRQLKSGMRIPAGNETEEVSATVGWSEDANADLQKLDSVYSDANVLAGIAGSALSVGNVVRVTGTTAIKVGLPGEERLFTWDAADATTQANCAGALGVVVERVPAGAIGPGDYVRVRVSGLVENTPVTGTPVLGGEVFVDDAGALSDTQGTVRRLVGIIAASNGGNWDVAFNGFLADISGGGGGGGVPSSRTISTTLPLSGGGDLTANRTLVLNYNATLTVSAGSLAVVYGTSANTAAQGNDARIVNAVQTSRTISTTAPLGGGGNLSANLTLTWSFPGETTGDMLSYTGGAWSLVNIGSAGFFLRSNGTNVVWQAATAADVGAVPTSRTLQGVSPIAVGGVYTPVDLSTNRVITFAIPSEAHGDIVFRGSSAWTRLPADNGKFLRSNGAGADPSWETIPAGTGSILYIWTDLYSGAAPLTAGTTTAGGAKFIVAEHGLPGSGQPVYLRVLHRRFSGASFVRYRLRNSSGSYVADLDGLGNNYLEFTGATPAIEEKQSVDLTGHTNFSVTVDDIYEVEIETDAGVVAIAERAYLLAQVSTAGGSYVLPFFLVGPAGSGPGGSSPAFSSITTALAAAPTSALIVVMDGTYVENPTITKSHRLISWSAFKGESGGGVVIDGTVTINPDAAGRKAAVQGIRCAPSVSGRGIYVTGTNACDVDLSFSEAYAPAGDAGVEIDNTSASTRVFAERLRAQSVLSRGYYAHGAAHVHRLNHAVIAGASTAVETGDGASVTLHSAQEITGKLVANGGIIVCRFGYIQAGAAAPFRIGGNGTLTAEFCRVDSTNTGDFVEYTGAGSATYLYSCVSVYGNAKQTFASGITPIPATTTVGNLEQTLTVTANVNEATDVLLLNHASVKIEATLPDPTRRLSRLFFAKNISSAQAHGLKAVGGTTINGSSSITLAAGVGVVLWAAFGTTDYKILAVYTPGSSGVVPFSRVPLSAKYSSVPGSTSLEKAGGGVWVSAEHDYSGSRAIKLRVALYSPDGTNNVRVKLWSVSAGNWVADLDGAANDYLQTSSATPTILTSVDLDGHTNFNAGGTGIYEVWVQSTNSGTTAELLSAEFIVG